MSLQRYLEKLTRSHETGSRVLKLDDDTFAIYDCPEWGQQQEYLLLKEFPECSVSIKSNHTSLSGFVLLISKPVTQKEMLWTFIISLLLAAIIIMFRDTWKHLLMGWFFYGINKHNSWEYWYPSPSLSHHQKIWKIRQSDIIWHLITRHTSKWHIMSLWRTAYGYKVT